MTDTPMPIPIEDIVKSYKTPLDNSLAATNNLDDSIRTSIYRKAQETTGKQIVNWQEVRENGELMNDLRGIILNSYDISNSANPIHVLKNGLDRIDNVAVTGAFNNVLFGYANKVVEGLLEAEDPYEGLKNAQVQGHNQVTTSALAMGASSELLKKVGGRNDDLVKYFSEKYNLQPGFDQDLYSKDKLVAFVQEEQTLAKLLIDQLKEDDVKVAIRKAREPSRIILPTDT